MRGTLILVVFFSVFTFASLLIPSPMFPGNVICTFIDGKILNYSNYLSALFNGVIYGVILWAVFVLISGRLGSKQ